MKFLIFLGLFVAIIAICVGFYAVFTVGVGYCLMYACIEGYKRSRDTIR